MKDATDQKWASAELASVSKVFTDGNWIETKDQASEGIRLVQTGNVGEGVFKDRRDKARWIDEQTCSRLNSFEVLPGDCLVSRLPDPVGRACIIPETGDKMITAVDCTVIRPDGAKIDPQFFVYYSQSSEYLRNVDDLCTGTTRRRISRKNLGKIPIPLPPLEEQQRIVEVLDEAFEGLARARAHAEANLQNARELFLRSLDSFFEADRNAWPTVSFGEVSEVKGGKRLPKGFQLQNEPTDWPYIRVADFDGQGGVDLTDIRYLTKEVHQSIKQYTISSRDVFITIVGATVGKSGILPEILDGANLTENACKLVLGDKVETKYVYYFTLSNSFLEQVGLNTRTAAQPKLALVRLKTITLGVPSLKRQKEVSDTLDRTRLSTQELEAKFSKKIRDLDDLRQSLLQKAFAGELGVQSRHLVDRI